MRDEAKTTANPSETTPDDTKTSEASGGGTALGGLRRITLIAIGIAMVFFVYAVLADRTTPFAGDARVQAFVLRVATELSGRVEGVGVEDNAIVEAGHELFRIEPTPFQLSVDQARARLAQAGQSVDASTSGIEVSQSRLEEARANEANVRAQSDRIFQMVDKGIYAQARGDQAQAAVDVARAAVESAQADLERAREELGPQGADNPQILDAMAALQSAEYDLARTKVFSPTRGVVTNLQLASGQTVSAGQPAMTFISADDVWLLASVRENSLSVIEPGQIAEVVLDTFPGQVFPARVRSVGWGIAGDSVDPATGLPKSTNSSGWLTDPQRFPVHLEFLSEARPVGVRYGSRAAVIIYARENAVMDAIAWARIRLISILTYVS